MVSSNRLIGNFKFQQDLINLGGHDGSVSKWNTISIVPRVSGDAEIGSDNRDYS